MNLLAEGPGPFDSRHCELIETSEVKSVVAVSSSSSLESVLFCFSSSRDQTANEEKVIEGPLDAAPFSLSAWIQ